MRFQTTVAALTKADVRFNWLSSSILGVAVVLHVTGLVFIAVGIQAPSTVLIETGGALTSLAVVAALVGFFAGLALNLSRRARRR